MKKSKKDDEGSYGLTVFIAVVLTIAIHYFFISDINIHPTIHLIIGMFILYLLIAALYSLVAKIWNKF